jgi:ribonuclease/clavin/mitogillin
MASHLVTLPAVERLSPRCIRILGGNPGKFTLQGTNTYLLGTGRRRILIDTGEGRTAWATSLKATLDQERATIASALITHWHHDHVGGIDDLLRISPGVTIYKCHPEHNQSAISDSQVFRTEGVTLTACHTPGHTTDHTVFILAEEDAMFTADNVLGQGTSVFEDLATYLASLEKMCHLFNGRAYPGHGPLIEDGPGKLTEYIQHRQERENQVIQTLQSASATGDGLWSAMDVVEAIYRDVPPALHIAAHGGVLQILHKLKAHGMVEQGGDDLWRITPSPNL